MRHVILTCKNHPELRWSTKECAVTNGKYNGQRNIFFEGRPVYNLNGTPKMYEDASGLSCTMFKDEKLIHECDCLLGDLVVAEEDKLVKRYE